MDKIKATIRVRLNDIILGLLQAKPIEPHKLNDGWRLYIDGEGQLCCLNRIKWSGWRIVTDKDGNRFKAQIKKKGWTDLERSGRNFYVPFRTKNLCLEKLTEE